MLNLMDPSTYMGESNSKNECLVDLNEFGSNPGALNAKIYIPADLPAGAPLVVVLHGCKQTAVAAVASHSPFCIWLNKWSAIMVSTASVFSSQGCPQAVP